MTPDQIADCMRALLKEALIISAPILIVASAVSLFISLLQTLTSIQDQTLSTVPRLVIVTAVIFSAMPWFLHRLIAFTVVLLGNLRPFVG